MNRRTFLRTSAGLTGGVIGGSTIGAAEQSEPAVHEFFKPLRAMTSGEINRAILKCADGLCINQLQSDVPLSDIENDSQKVNSHLRRVRYGIRILNEQNITTAIDESMVRETETIARQTTRYIPLIGSFNRLQSVACDLSNRANEASVRDFLYASIAFGLEVSLWQSTMPYQMAWSGVRFTSTRTFLRYADKGCNGCIAFVMSELHWAIRAVPYEISTDNNVEFVVNELERLHEEAAQIEVIDWEFIQSSADIRAFLGNESLIGGGAAITVSNANRSPQFSGFGVLIFVLAAILAGRSIFD